MQNAVDINEKVFQGKVLLIYNLTLRTLMSDSTGGVLVLIPRKNASKCIIS